MRILQVGLGPPGRMVVADLYARGMGRVLAAVDSDQRLAGRSVGGVAEVDEAVAISASLQAAALGQPIDAAIVTTSSRRARPPSGSCSLTGSAW